MKKIITILICLCVVILVWVFISNRAVENNSRENTVETKNVTTTTKVENDTSAPTAPVAATERYSAQVDRVKVIFEQWNYTRYRLQTNDLVREGEFNTERGYEDDPDATVYVLNWQQSEGQHIYYVRLTAEPNYLYVLDSEMKIIRGGRLAREE